MIRLSFYHSINNYDDKIYYDNNNFYPPDIELEIFSNSNSIVIYFTQKNISVEDWYNIWIACKQNISYKILINDPDNKLSIYTKNGYTYFELFGGNINNTIIKLNNNKTTKIFERIYQRTIFHNYTNV
ncbi:hypothetical protein H012_gp236 [Acanthamoeba polyphaga moumouvirus]|uniref:Uncharacterized protein n=2 Tax=Moumouvirus TaxID=3080801 RepID=L7RD63_9VIRU|nr:hypothetical protein H012_gp236 [Acanthamoeba polyphaga moumouvirus]AEX62448.1 hypothetical protein mv_L243 [Moumouvirus Monve]AGC02216.1 hypothetical protein Moumou_00695 [Acanthamoeba polyphaga moumouvirus]AQN68785.1 hypothetical protein [Saudi moumouvirus]